MPLANALRNPDDASPEAKYPLRVLFCRDCALSQLSVVVPPAEMFRWYPYRSSISKTFRRHCVRLVEEVKERTSLPTTARVIDIGSNDGTLLAAFRERGFRVLGVDPAENLAHHARAAGVETHVAYWGLETAREVVVRWGRAECITATNVLAHVDDLGDFFAGIGEALAESGHFVVEVPYLADLVEKSEFDTIYHEHVSYFLLRPLLSIAARHGLRADYVRRIPVHGGGLRAYFAHDDGEAKVPDTVRATLAFEEEAGLYEEAPYHRFAREVASIQNDLRRALERLRAERRRVAAYGASAKGATLLNSIEASPDLVEYIVDDTPEKQGLLQPGTGIPVVPRSSFDETPPDYLLILAWNFVDEILEKTRGFGGRYIVPVPTLRVLP